jgi:DNA-binding response OmpR family regulator
MAPASFRVYYRTVSDNEIGQSNEAASAAFQCQTTPPHRILVVDDEACMRHLNAKMLMDAGYQVDAAEDGAAAWNTLQAKRYDLLITDNTMPKVSGFELIEKVRAAGMALPVIMATGAFPTAEFAKRPQLIPAATLLKPYSLAEFLGTVKSVLCGAVFIIMLQLCLAAAGNV